MERGKGQQEQPCAKAEEELEGERAKEPLHAGKHERFPGDAVSGPLPDIAVQVV